MLVDPDHALGFGTLEDFEPPQRPNPQGSKQFYWTLPSMICQPPSNAWSSSGPPFPPNSPAPKLARVNLGSPLAHPTSTTTTSFRKVGALTD